MWGRVCVEQYVTRSLQDSTRQHNAFWAIEISNLELVSNIPGTLSVFLEQSVSACLKTAPQEACLCASTVPCRANKTSSFLGLWCHDLCLMMLYLNFFIILFYSKKFNSSKIVVFVQKRRFVWEDSSKKIHRRKFIGEDLPETPVRCSIASNNCDLCE